MPLPYNDQLLAIREMLSDPAPEITQEGYDLLFKLWLANHENPEFRQELIQDAINHHLLISELRKRLRELRLKNSITGTYLRDRFESFAADVEIHRSKLSTETKSPVSLFTAKIETPENKTTNLPWWQALRMLILLVSILLIFFLPNTYQKIIAFAITAIIIFTIPYLLSRRDHIITTDLPGIKLSYSLPKYLSIGDENIIDLSVENSNENTFNGVITLVFDDKDSLITPIANQSMSAKIEVSSFGREARQFKFILKNKPLDGNANYYFQVFSSDGSRYKTNNEFFSISPIPYLRSTSAWLFGSAGLGALILALLWEQFKNWLGLK